MEIQKRFLAHFTIVTVITSSSAFLNRTKTHESHYWNVPTLGEFANAIVRKITGNKKEIINESLPSIRKSFQDFIVDVMKKSLKNQTRLAIFSAVGGMLTFFVTFTSLIIYFWAMRVGRDMEHKKHSLLRKNDPSIVIVSRVTLTLLTLGIFFSVAMVALGGALIFIGTNSVGKVNIEMLNLINSSVNDVYVVKAAVMEALELVPEELRRLADTSMKDVLIVREKLAVRFREAISPQINKILHTASSLMGSIRHLDYANDLQVNKLKNTRSMSKNLETQLRDLYESIDRDTTISDETKTLKEKLEKLANTHASEFLHLGIGVNEKGSPTLRKLMRNFQVNLASKTLWSLFDLPAIMEIDPTEVIKNIRDIGTLVFEHGMYQMESSFSFYDWILPEEGKQNVVQVIQEIKTKAISILNKVWRFFMYTGVVALGITFPIAVATVLGVIGTNFFEKLNKNGYRRNLLSNSAGNILEAGLYVASIFLWVYWFLSSLLLVITAVPVNLCWSFESREITKLNFSYFETGYMRNVSENYLNATVSEYVRPCEEEIRNSFSPKENVERFINISSSRKVEIFETVEKNVENLVAAIPPLNSTGILEACLELAPRYAQIDIYLDDSSLELRNIQKNLSAIQIYIKQMLSNPNITAATRQNMSVISLKCKELEKNAGEVAKAVETHVDDMDFPEHDVETVENNAFKLGNVSYMFNNFLRNKVKYVLFNTFKKLTDDYEFGLAYSIEYGRDNFYLTGCQPIWSMYQRLTRFICHRYLSSISSLWLGETLVATFLLIAIIAGVPTAWLFKFPEQRELMTQDKAESIERDYIKRSRSMSYDMLMSSIVKRGSLDGVSDGEKREFSHRRTESLLTSITEERAAKIS